MLDELRSGAIHLTGLFLLSRYVTPENVEALLAQARGKSRSELQELIARWFPRSDVPERVVPLVNGAGAGVASATCAGTGGPGAGTDSQAGAGAPYRLEPLSPSRYLVQFTASAELHQKITQARELLSHVLPSGDVAALFERALDALLEREVRRRMGVGRARRKNAPSAAPAPTAVPTAAPATAEPSDVGAHAMAPRATAHAMAPTEPVAHTATERRCVAPNSATRASTTMAGTAAKPETPAPSAAMTPRATTKPETPAPDAEATSVTTEVMPMRTASRSRYVPRAVARAVWERDGGQCTFVNGEGRRCRERRFMTLEHREPHALGGEASVENLCLLCRSHNVHAGRRLFGERRRSRSRGHIQEASATETEQRVLRGLCGLGFRERDARRAVAEVRGEVEAGVEGGNDAAVLLRAAVLRLTSGRHP